MMGAPPCRPTHWRLEDMPLGVPLFQATLHISRRHERDSSTTYQHVQVVNLPLLSHEPTLPTSTWRPFCITSESTPYPPPPFPSSISSTTCHANCIYPPPAHLPVMCNSPSHVLAGRPLRSARLPQHLPFVASPSCYTQPRRRHPNDAGDQPHDGVRRVLFVCPPRYEAPNSSIADAETKLRHHGASSCGAASRPCIAHTSTWAPR